MLELKSKLYKGLQNDKEFSVFWSKEICKTITASYKLKLCMICAKFKFRKKIISTFMDHRMRRGRDRGVMLLLSGNKPWMFVNDFFLFDLFCITKTVSLTAV